MKKLKVLSRYVWALAFCLAFGVSAKAQQAPGSGNGNPESRMQNRMDRLKQKLDLNDEQVSKITLIYKQSQLKLRDIRANNGDNRQAMHMQRREIMKNADAQVMAILNPDQQQKWQTMKENMKSKRGNPNPTPKPQE